MFQDRYDSLLGTLTDEFVREELAASAADNADARELVFNHLVGEFRNLKVAQEVQLREPQRSGLDVRLALDLKWSRLASNIKCAAELLCLRKFLRYSSANEARRKLRRNWRRFLPWAETDEIPAIDALGAETKRSRQLMLLWLEATLFRIRSSSNIQPLEEEAAGVGGENPTRKAIAEQFGTYYGSLKDWDSELRSLTGRLFFQSGFAIAPQLRRLSREFGPAATTTQDEGWAAQAADARTELRYQWFDEVRRERWRAGKRFSAFAYWLLKITTGYGTRPSFFVWTATFFVVLFSGLFFLNDLLNPGIPAVMAGKPFCTAAQVKVNTWYDPILIFLRYLAHYLYLAVTNLASLGSSSAAASYCGGTMTQVLLTCSAIIGYFMLAVLAALSFKLLTEAE